MTELTAFHVAPEPRQAVGGRRGSRFFLGASLSMLLIVILGFAPTFYLRSFFPVRPIPLYLYLHGIVMTTWYALFVIQTGLVAADRRDLHRRLGIAGVIVAVGVVALGFYVNKHLQLRVESLAIPLSPQRLAFLNAVIVLGLLLLGAFSLFVAAAVALRRRPEAHRRLMFLALLATLPPAIGPGRWLGKAFAPLLPAWPGLIELVTWGCVIALGSHDWSTRRRIHPVTLWGGLLLVAIELTASVMTGNMLRMGAR